MSVSDPLRSITARRLDALEGLTRAKAIIQKLCDPTAATQSVLLYGPKGGGKSELARALIEAWACRQPTKDGACGECESCLAYEKGGHPDLLYVGPQPPSRLIRLSAIFSSTGSLAPGPAAKGGEEQPVQSFLATRPIRGRNKVVWIKDADRMNGDAANALLKTLEEPPEYSRFVLTTSSISSVPATISSRCLAIACPACSREEVEQVVGPLEDWQWKLSEGAPGRAKWVLNSDVGLRPVYEFSSKLARAQPRMALKMAEVFRDIAAGLIPFSDDSVRGSTAAALEVLAVLVSEQNPRLARTIVETHRRILASASAPIALDALFAQALLPEA